MTARGEPSLSVLVPVTERARPLADIYRELKPLVEPLGGAFEFVFVILIFVYVGLMNRLDKEFQVEEEEKGGNP